MRYSSLPLLEKKLRETGNGGEYTLRKVAVPVPGEELTLNALFCTPNARSGYYHDSVHPKERILLHFTAGQIRSDLSALSRRDYHVSVPFVIARDGTIYQLYSSKYWSGNIGKGLGNVNNAEDKRTISIEISNYGFLTERAGNLETYYSRMKDANGNEGPVDIYCSLAESEAYQKLAAPFRGQSYYATYTREQYQSLIILLRYLTAQYHIPREFLPEPIRYQTTEEVLSFKGIVSHVNYRSTGKWDIGPAFDWNKVITGVQSAAFVPDNTLVISRSLSGDELISEPAIRSEEELIPFHTESKGVESENEEYEDLNSSIEVEEKDKSIRRKKLYALLVGIDAYEEDIILEESIHFPRLRGCVKDMQKVKAYLEGEAAFDSDIRLLTNKEASKEAIVTAFREHLGKAGKDDVALFFFSGHGTQEWADTEAWKFETDGRLECIACYYNKETKEDFLLADKELRFLLKGLSERTEHIVAMFDCCHSGDNTRNGIFVKSSFDEVVEKRIPFSFKQRAWEQFIFSNRLSKEELIRKGEKEALPEGLHIQISACESDESAMEVAGEGVFTKAVLSTLRAADGDVTYQALRNRVRQYLRNVYEQKPRIYVVNGDENLLYSTFLNRLPGKKAQSYGDVIYNEKTGWQLSLGAIHGISLKQPELRIFDPQNRGRNFTAIIKKVKADISLLHVEGNPDPSLVYQGYVEGMLGGSLRIQVHNVDGTPASHSRLMEAISTSTDNFLVLEEKEEQVQYVIHNSNGKNFITRAGDGFRPIAHPVNAEDTENGTIIVNQLKQIATWEHLKDLVNEDESSRLNGSELKIEVFTVLPNGTEELVNRTDGEVRIDYHSEGDGYKAELKVRLTNTSNVNLYCAALLLSYDFGSLTHFLSPELKMLEPGNSVTLNDGMITLGLDEEIKWYNWKEQLEYLKFIVSSEEIDIARLRFSELPHPAIPGGEKGIEERTRGVIKQLKKEVVRGWTTYRLTLRQPNPEYNRISQKDLAIMMEDEDTADFGLGIYFDARIGENLLPVYMLKPEIDLKEGDKSFFSDVALDLANAWARKRRNNRYHSMVNKFPDKPRIVSEGDSWFQHPLVLDVIDHVSRLYPVYCVAAAGDTLRNYLSREHARGEHYLDAIEREQPGFFIVSGGGNDILGSQFRTYLADNPDHSSAEGKDPSRFLRPTIFQELDDLATIYSTMFGNLQTNYPELKVIVHGYDYPVKLNDAKKGWLGRYMIEKGIDRVGDRKAVIRLIMDEFNDRLKKACAEFNNVTYLNVRDLVRFSPEHNVDQWYDEIHPNNDGFQLVAMKFIQTIDALYGKKPGGVRSVSQENGTRSGGMIPGGAILSTTESALPKTDIEATPRGWKEMELETMAEASSNEGETETGPTPDWDDYPMESGALPMASAAEPIESGTAVAAPKVNEGQLEYDIPDTMQMGSFHPCSVWIADNQVAAELIKISEDSVHQTIRIGMEMSVQLIDATGGENFQIIEKNNVRQAIFPGEITKWNFSVRPKTIGRHPLSLRVTLHLDNRNKDLDILEKDVLVNSDGTVSPHPVTIKRVLLMAANPDDTTRLRIGKEIRTIKEEIAMGNERNAVLFTYNVAATIRTLQRSILQDKPTILHFSGHGETEGLCLETEEGRSKTISADALAQLFSNFSDSIQCVVLNACYSETQALAVVQHIPFVIGMNKAVRDDAAVIFSMGFYGALAEGKDIEMAFNLGKSAMSLHDDVQGKIPVLLKKAN